MLSSFPILNETEVTQDSRRNFLFQIAGLAAGAAAGSGVTFKAEAAKAPVLSPGFFLNPKTQKSRKRAAYKLRTGAAHAGYRAPIIELATNGDEDSYASTRIANFSKSLPHDDHGVVDHGAYDKFIEACTAGTAEAFEAVPGGPLQLKNPLGGYSFTMEGADPFDLFCPAPPSFASAEMASEMVECYWHALLRDVPFADYDTNELSQLAAIDLNRLPAFRGPREQGTVTTKNLFRGTWQGCNTGPFLSQFLLKDFEFGHTFIPQKFRSGIAETDYLTTWPEWLSSQRGVPITTAFPSGDERYIISGRDLAHHVHIDFPSQLPLTAGLVLIGLKAPSNQGDPYRHLTRQCGFATYAYPHMVDAVSRVSTLALKSAWRHKYTLHRRLRPEEFAARVHDRIVSNAPYPIHPDLLGSRGLQEVFAKWGSYLLPQAYPEGCPPHPAYPSGHATFVAAGITMIKAFYDENWVIPDPVVPSADGQSLVPYEGPVLTVGGELNKLAANVAIGRNIAGVHWRTDAAEGNLLGERVAIAVLRDLKGCYVESANISFRSLQGDLVTI